jgi:hypothetical protein
VHVSSYPTDDTTQYSHPHEGDENQLTSRFHISSEGCSRISSLGS